MRKPNKIAASLIKLASGLYPDGLVGACYDPKTNRAVRNPFGEDDTLAEFITREIIDVTKGYPQTPAGAVEALGEVVKALRRAKKQIAVVTAGMDNARPQSPVQLFNRKLAEASYYRLGGKAYAIEDSAQITEEHAEQQPVLASKGSSVVITAAMIRQASVKNGDLVLKGGLTLTFLAAVS